jgi:hypothetical protein
VYTGRLDGGISRQSVMGTAILRHTVIFKGIKPERGLANTHFRRIEALENKIEELMRSRANSPTSDAVPPPPETAPHSRSGSVVGNESPRSSHGATLSIQSNGSNCDIIEAGFLTAERAEHLLGIYKTSMTPHFPFVVIPPQMTAEQLRQEKPFLYLALLASASFHDMPLQRRLGALVKQTISDRVVTGESVSFEVLQGLLVFIAWCVALWHLSGMSIKVNINAGATINLDHDATRSIYSLP